MKLIVLNKAMFKINELSVDKLTAFLISKGFYDVDDWHFDIDYSVCTAEYNGKINFEMPDIEMPEFYLHRIALKGMDFKNRTEYNANMLNELCRKNGRER